MSRWGTRARSSSTDGLLDRSRAAVLPPLSRPLVIAHRGASAERPENTIAAFRLAEAQGADGVELDVMRCATGETVVFHDDDLARLCKRPERVRQSPWPLLAEARVGGERIPSLDEVLEAVGRDLLVNVELKSPERSGLGHVDGLRDDGLAAEVARIVSRHGASDRVLVSSFDPVQLVRIRRAAPSLPIGLLFHADLSLPLRDAWAAALLRAEALHPEAAQLSARFVARAHRRGRRVNVWTVDAPGEIAFLQAIGADGIITNRPGLARRVLAGERDPSSAERAQAGAPASPAAG